MPKVVRSSKRRLICTTEAQHINTSIAQITAPRKVSFEEGHRSFELLLSEVRSSIDSPRPSDEVKDSPTSSPSLRRSPKSGQLKRPRPSACLVELAEDENNCPSSPSSCNDVDYVSDSRSSQCSSPWGHFVDLVVPSDESSDSDDDAYYRVGGHSNLYGFSRSSSYEPYPKLRRAPYSSRLLLPNRRFGRTYEKKQPQSYRGYFLSTTICPTKPVADFTGGVEHAFRKLHM